MNYKDVEPSDFDKEKFEKMRRAKLAQKRLFNESDMEVEEINPNILTLDEIDSIAANVVITHKYGFIERFWIKCFSNLIERILLDVLSHCYKEGILTSREKYVIYQTWLCGLNFALKPKRKKRRKRKRQRAIFVK